MLSQINNAYLVGKSFIELPHSSLLESVAKVLSKNGYVGEVRRFKDGEKDCKCLHIDLEYTPSGKIPFSTLKRVSRQGCRIYRGVDGIKRNRRGIFVISTSSYGVISNIEALKKGVGGEVLLEIA